MSSRIHTGYEQLDSLHVRKVDEICDRFERECRNRPPDQWPSIEAFLESVGESARAALLRELIVLEIGYRRRYGHSLDANRYASRFPELRDSWIRIAIGDDGVTTLTKPADPPREESIRLPNFIVGEELGRGGMSVVYRAEQIEPRRTVALKILRDAALADEQVVKRLKREAQAIAQLRHPNIIQVFDVGESSTRPYLALEYAQHGNLADWLKGRVLEPKDAAFLALTLANALSHAHEHGVLHRDLKPGNILLCRQRPIFGRPDDSDAATSDGNKPLILQGRGPIPKISDFGLAKIVEDNASMMTQSGDMLGTPCYMAPEQALGQHRELTQATDVYGLGAILYEVLTGRPPFRGATTAETLLLVQQTDPVTPHRIRPNCPPELAIITMKCLEKDPERRYLSAAELADDLSRFLEQRPIIARAPSLWQNSVKWAKRRPAIASLALVTAVSIVSLLLLWQRAVTKSAEAERARQIAEIESEEKEIARRLAVDEGREKENALRQSKASLYARNVALASRELWANNTERSRQLLEECRPEKPNWEWRFLNRVAHSESWSINGHSDFCEAIAYNPDASRLASFDHRGRLRVWDATSHDQIFEISLPLESGIWFGSITFADGGNLLCACGPGNYVYVVDVRLRQLTSVLGGHRGRVNRLVVSPDGRRIASCGNDGSIYLWDPRKGERLRQIVEPNATRHPVFGIAWTPDGESLVSGSTENVVVWNVATGEVTRKWKVDSSVLDLKVSPDGKLFATSSIDRFVRLLNAETGDEVLSLPMENGFAWHVGFSPDGQHLATAGFDGTLKLWSTSTGTAWTELFGHSGSINCVVFNPNGLEVVSAGSDGTVRGWDLSHLPSAHLVIDKNWITCSALSPDGKTFATGRRDGRVVIRDSIDGVAVEASVPNPVEVNVVRFDDTGKYVAIAYQKAGVSVWERGTDKPKKSSSTEVADTRDLMFTADGTLLAAVASGIAAVWDVTNQRQVFSLQELGHTLVGATFSSDKKLIAANYYPPLVNVYQVEDGKKIRSHNLFPNDDESTLKLRFPMDVPIAFTRDNSRLALEHADHTVAIWNWRTDEAPVICRGHNAQILACAFSPDGSRLATTGVDWTIKIWDVVSGEDLLTLRRHTDYVHALLFSEDGDRLISAGRDNTVRIWSASEKRILIRPSELFQLPQIPGSWKSAFPFLRLD